MVINLVSSFRALFTCHMSPFVLSYGPRREKTCLRGFANNKGADQPVHPHSLISVFVILLLESIISRLATSEIFNFLACLCS